MIEGKKFIGAALAGLEAFYMLTHPTPTVAQCLTLPEIYQDQTIFVAGETIELPTELEVLMVTGNPHLEKGFSKIPCYEDPTLIIHYPNIYGYNPRIHIKVRTAAVDYEVDENIEDPFGELIAQLPQIDSSADEFNFPQQ